MKTSSMMAWQQLLSVSAEDPFFLGSALTAYRTHHDLDLQQLADWLRCPPAKLDRLALCRLPNEETPRFQDDVRKIAAFTSCDADRLVILLREVAALRSLRNTAEVSPEALLMAARDRKKREEEEP